MSETGRQPTGPKLQFTMMPRQFGRTLAERQRQAMAALKDIDYAGIELRILGHQFGFSATEIEMKTA